MRFGNYFKQESFSTWEKNLHDFPIEVTSNQKTNPSYTIQNILDRCQNGRRLIWNDLSFLLSSYGDDYFDSIVECARKVTRKRFGKVIQFYSPLYLSNYCHSTCTYCGFSRTNKIHRLTLSVDDAVEEAKILHQKGIRHILLLTGEDYKETPISYLKEIISKIYSLFASVSIEVYPLETADYQILRAAGLSGVAIYQETYDPKRYKEVHLGGVKKRFYYRLDCPDRVGLAHIKNISVGALLGLSDPATDVYSVAVHTQHLLKNYWKSEVSISLPRLRPAVGLDIPPTLSDKDYIRYLCSLRLFFPEIALFLSTRESPLLRDYLSTVCITHMSAGSKTEPGGYSGKKSTEQFSILDNRSLSELKSALGEHNLEGGTVDWHSLLR